MDSHSGPASDLRAAILAADAAGFPFKSELTLEPLIRFWTETIGRQHSVKGVLAETVRQELERAPELFGPIQDLSVIERHRPLVDVLMAMVFPPAFWEREVGAAMIPGRLRSFYATPSFERLLMAPDGMLQGQVSFDETAVARVRLLHTYALILRRLYGIELPVQYPLTVTVTDPDTGLDRHFKMEFDSTFVVVEPVDGLPPLPPEARRSLGELGDPRRLMELLPPDRFASRGFTVFRAADVTDQEVLSSLKRDLIDKESIISTARFRGLEAKLQTLFRLRDLRLGLAAVQGDQVLMLSSGTRLENACIFADSAHHHVSEFAGSIYDRAVRQGAPLIVEDLEASPGGSTVDEHIRHGGIRSIVAAPLHYQNELIGTLELASPRPGDLTAAQLPRLQEVLPLFSMAVKRSVEEFNARVQTFIKEKCTAIHPSVEWRFRRAVFNGLERQRTEGAATLELEPIVFDEIYPLYALADIRGSSTQRALAIQADLVEQLALARDVLQAAYRAKALPILDELAYRVQKYAGQIEAGLRSGDETEVVTFLRNEVEPVFDRVRDFGPEVQNRAKAYREALDPRLGTVYRQRKHFEEGVTLLTETISSYLDLEEQAAQGMIPHYFEKQKTDGVDYGIYVGTSLLEDGAFDLLHLKNLRLWQLMVTCGIALRTERLKERLTVPLEVTHLVLVQHAPLSIRFRMDEKRFDVDGAYNIRYEIVKKRIDKATVRGTSERLTQPGKIAIVYSQPKEAEEYRQYLDYLQHAGYLMGPIEDLELEELQGMQGLRALRVTVDLSNARVSEPTRPGDLQAALRPSSSV